MNTTKRRTCNSCAYAKKASYCQSFERQCAADIWHRTENPSGIVGARQNACIYYKPINSTK